MANRFKQVPVRRGRPRLVKNFTPNIIRDIAARYFADCDQRLPNPRPYTIEGLCNALNIHVSTFRDWQASDSPLAEPARMLHQRIAQARIEGGLDGSLNPAFCRFTAVNNFPESYSDKLKVEGAVDPKLASIFDAVIGNKLP